MAKLSEKYADKSITGHIDNFIYFSQVNSGHGPCIKFYGGTDRTSATRQSPAFGFSKDGATEIQLEPWMNKDNCPNAFDRKYLGGIKNFINAHLAILELVWHKHIDESDALAYFQGQIGFSDLLEEIDYAQEYEDILYVSSENELHRFCLDNDLYRF